MARIDWDRRITPGNPTHRIVPRMPDMSWLGEPFTDEEAARFEKRRAEILRKEHT